MPPRFAHRELLLAKVDDEDGVRLTLHVGDAPKIFLQLLELGPHGDPFLGRKQLQLALLVQPPQLVEPVDAARDRAPIGEQSSEPAVVDVRHADALRLFLDGGLRLFLRAHEQDGAISLGEVAREGVRFLQQLEGLLQVDDVDAAALRAPRAAPCEGRR